MLFVLSHSVILRVKICFLSGGKHSRCHRQTQAQFSVLIVTATPVGDNGVEEEAYKSQTEGIEHWVILKKEERQQQKRNKRDKREEYVGNRKNADEYWL